MAEQDSADRPRDESDSERRIREQGADEWILIRKEQFVEHQAGDDAVEKEVIPFDDAADCAGECDALDFVGVRNVVRAVHACFLLFVGERASIQVIGCNQAQQHSAAIVLLL